MTHPYRSPAEVPKHPRWGATRSARAWVRVYRWFKPKRTPMLETFDAFASADRHLAVLEGMVRAYLRMTSRFREELERCDRETLVRIERVMKTLEKVKR